MEKTLPFLKDENLIGESEEEENYLLNEGDVINNRYVIVSLIGVGGMAEVYRAYDKTLSRDVALKFFFSKSEVDFSIISKLRKISSDTIVSIYDIGKWNGKTYLVLEYVEGKNLKNFKIINWTFSKKLFLIKKIVEGINALHKAGILHLDLKPSNILISKEGDVKIADFSVSKNILSHTESKGGSLRFIAPEQLLDDEVDERTDIYQLGLLMKWILIENNENYSKENPDTVNIPLYMEKIINKCLSPDKSERFENVNKISEIIEKNERKTKRRKIGITVFIFLLFLMLYIIIGNTDKNPNYYVKFRNKALIFNKFLYPMFIKDLCHKKLPKNFRPIEISDLDNDGKNEIITVSIHKEVGVERPIWVLKVFSSNGDLLWEKTYYRIIKTAIGRVYKRPLSFRKFIIKDLDGNSKKEIVTFSNHVFFPFFIEVMDFSGKVISTFVSSGHLNPAHSLIYDYDKDGVSEIIIGGVNNEYNKAVFMILDPFKMTGKTPQKKPYYDIVGYKVAKFETLIRFPRSTLNRRYEIRNRVHRITLPDNMPIVEISELKHRELRKKLLYDEEQYPTLYYFFDKKLRLIDFEISDWYKIGISVSGIKIDYDKETKKLLGGVERWDGKRWVPVEIVKDSVAWNMVYGEK